MNITEVIENAKNLTGSDAATARQIGVVSGRIAEWKSGVRTPTPEQAAALADFIGVPWWVVVAASEAAAAERRGDIPKARQWRDRISQVTAPVVLAAVLGLIGMGHPNEADAAQKSMTWRGLSTIYIMDCKDRPLSLPMSPRSATETQALALEVFAVFGMKLVLAPNRQ